LLGNNIVAIDINNSIELVFCFEMESFYVVQAGLQLSVLLFLKSWECSLSHHA
jgi:hypothetical protein